MKTEVIGDADTLFAALADLFRWAERVDMSYAWASSAGGSARHWKAMEIAKVSRAVIGTAFARTEPAALLALANGVDRLRLVITSTGTFHPKVIVGSKGPERRAIVGSANFTDGAYTKNTELSVLMCGKQDDEQILAIERFIEAQWHLGVPLTDKWLADYTLVWDRERRRKVVVPGAAIEITSLASLEMSWNDYVQLLDAQEKRRISDTFTISVDGPTKSYFWELNRAAEIFAKANAFADLDADDRRFLMGMGESTGLLGSLGGAGDAMGIALRTPEGIGKALDQLPLQGDVSLANAKELMIEMADARGINYGVASRLFAAKRPDLFVSVNNGSEPKLREALGKRINSIDRYIDFLGRVWSTAWHASQRPTDRREAALWDRRAAILDSALYVRVLGRAS